LNSLRALFEDFEIVDKLKQHHFPTDDLLITFPKKISSEAPITVFRICRDFR